MTNPQIGDKVIYHPRVGPSEVARIDSIGTAGDFKDGEPTVDVTILSTGAEHWGYLDQIS